MKKSVVGKDHKLSKMSTQEVQKLTKQVKEEFGFAKEEIRFIVRHKPSFLLWQDQASNSNKGIYALQKFFVEKYGFSQELLKSLVVKYPYILSKDVDHL